MEQQHDFDNLVTTINEHIQNPQQKIISSTKSTLGEVLQFIKESFQSLYSFKRTQEIGGVFSQVYGLPSHLVLTPRQRDAIMLASDIVRAKEKLLAEVNDEEIQQGINKTAAILYEQYRHAFHTNSIL